MYMRMFDSKPRSIACHFSIIVLFTVTLVLVILLSFLGFSIEVS